MSSWSVTRGVDGKWEVCPFAGFDRADKIGCYPSRESAQGAADMANTPRPRLVGTERPTEYPTDLDPRELEPQFSRHMLALTAEGLHDKSAIAEQLAWRDQQLAKLRLELALVKHERNAAEARAQARTAILGAGTLEEQNAAFADRCCDWHWGDSSGRGDRNQLCRGERFPGRRPPA